MGRKIIPSEEIPTISTSKLPYENWENFIKELVEISNKYRIVIVIDRLMEMRTEPIDGILLDFAGYYRSSDGKILPSFVNRLSNDEEDS